jgi:hypothetical protein
MAFRASHFNLTTSDQDVFLCPANTEGAIKTLAFFNRTANARTISLKVFDQSANATYTLLAATSVPANGMLTVPGPFVMSGDRVIAACDQANAVVAAVSDYLDTDTPYVSVYQPRGLWSSALTYVRGDLVHDNTGFYVCIQTNTNSPPSTSTADWMVLPLGPRATAAQLRAGVDDVAINTAKTYSDALDWVDLGDVSGTVTLDLSSGFNFHMRLIGNITLAVPSNMRGGANQGLLDIVQDGTGNRTLSLNSAIMKPNGSAPSLTSTANATDRAAFAVRSGVFYLTSFDKDLK